MGWGELTGFFGSEPNFPTPNFLELKKTWISKRAQKNYFRVSPIRFFGFFSFHPYFYQIMYIRQESPDKSSSSKNLILLGFVYIISGEMEAPQEPPSTTKLMIATKISLTIYSMNVDRWFTYVLYIWARNQNSDSSTCVIWQARRDNILGTSISQHATNTSINIYRLQRKPYQEVAISNRNPMNQTKCQLIYEFPIVSQKSILNISWSFILGSSASCSQTWSEKNRNKNEAEVEKNKIK